METPARKVSTDSKPLTTFVQADTTTFKDVVQRLTGSSEPTQQEVTTGKGSIGVKRPGFKLHERRQYKAKLEIIKPPLSIKQGAAIMQQHFQEQQESSPSASGNRVHQTSPMSTPTKYFSSLTLVERESRSEPATPNLVVRGKLLQTDHKFQDSEIRHRESQTVKLVIIQNCYVKGEIQKPDCISIKKAPIVHTVYECKYVTAPANGHQICHKKRYTIKLEIVIVV